MAKLLSAGQQKSFLAKLDASAYMISRALVPAGHTSGAPDAEAHNVMPHA
jgi:hypothetical protein